MDIHEFCTPIWYTFKNGHKTYLSPWAIFSSKGNDCRIEHWSCTLGPDLSRPVGWQPGRRSLNSDRYSSRSIEGSGRPELIQAAWHTSTRELSTRLKGLFRVPLGALASGHITHVGWVLWLLRDREREHENLAYAETAWSLFDLFYILRVLWIQSRQYGLKVQGFNLTLKCRFCDLWSLLALYQNRIDRATRFFRFWFNIVAIGWSPHYTIAHFKSNTDKLGSEHEKLVNTDPSQDYLISRRLGDNYH